MTCSTCSTSTVRSIRPSCSNAASESGCRSDLGVRSAALFLLLALPLAGAASASEFSADIVSRDASGAVTGTTGKVYVWNGKVRIEETTDATTGYFLIDGATATALFVRPAQQVFMDARQSTRITRIFLPVDPANPCAQWQAAARNAGVPGAGGDWHCEHAQTTRVDGAVEYTVTSPDGESTQRWIAAKLQFPVKLRASDGTTLTLEHIRLEAPTAALFSVPAGYRKSDPQALLDRIKHSDVWVEPPK
jgi:hypothetical protein